MLLCYTFICTDNLTEYMTFLVNLPVYHAQISSNESELLQDGLLAELHSLQ